MFGASLFALVMASGAYAYTATNSVPASKAGAGWAAIAGYAVVSIAYDLNNTDPEKIDKLTFMLSPTDARTVKVRLRAAGSWHTCGNLGGSVTCPASGVFAAETVTDATGLTVVALENTDT